MFDYQHFSGLYRETRKASNYAITFTPGVSPSNWIVDGNCGAFTGKGGIYLNNQGTPAETTSMIRISHFCGESEKESRGDPGGYGIYMDFGTGNPACGNLLIENFSVNSASCNGYYLKKVSAMVAVNINCGFAPGNDVFTCMGCEERIHHVARNWHPQTRLRTKGMRAQTLHKLAGSTEASPSIAFGIFTQAATDTPGTNLVYEKQRANMV